MLNKIVPVNDDECYVIFTKESMGFRFQTPVMDIQQAHSLIDIVKQITKK